MWEPVRKDNESLGLAASNVGELKEMLKYVPDDYSLSVIGVNFGMLIDAEDKVILIDEVPYLENLLIEGER